MALAEVNRITGHKNPDLVGRYNHVPKARAISTNRAAGVAASRRTMTLPMIKSILENIIMLKNFVKNMMKFYTLILM